MRRNNHSEPTIKQLPEYHPLKTSPPAATPIPFTTHRSLLFISLLSIGLGLTGGVVAPALMRLIGLITNLAFYGRIATSFVSPADNHLGLLVVFIPAIGGIIVGIMARFGSKAIRGHGIPEAMEQVLEGNSRIPARVTILKPVSAAVAIGTGGPFGAEGPIIATGGALGSLVGRLLVLRTQEELRLSIIRIVWIESFLNYR